ncbi:Vir protein, partial [Legionella pneumophila]
MNYRRSSMQSIQNILVNVTPQKTCSAHPVSPKNETTTMSSSSKDTFKAERRIDLLFSKFAAFYGHVWRSQFKDEVFLKFAKKEWQEALSDFTVR